MPCSSALTCLRRRRSQAQQARTSRRHRPGRALFPRHRALRLGGEGAPAALGTTYVPFLFADQRPALPQADRDRERHLVPRCAQATPTAAAPLTDWFTPEGLQGKASRSTWRRRRGAQGRALQLRLSAAALPAAGHRGGRGGSCRWPPRDAGRHGDRHRQDQARHRAPLPAPERQALPPRLLRRRPQRARRADAGRVLDHQGRSGTKTFADIFDLKGLDDVDARPRHPRPHLHHPGAGQARALSPTSPPMCRPSTSTT